METGLSKEPTPTGEGSLQGTQMAEDVAPECRRRLQQALVNTMRLQRIPYQFIRIQFRRVRRQEKQPQAAVRRLHEPIGPVVPDARHADRR